MCRCSGWRSIECAEGSPVQVQLHAKAFGQPDAGEGMHFDFSGLVAHAAHMRDLAAGCIVGGGTVSKK